MLRLLADPIPAPRARRCPPRAGTARRPRALPRLAAAVGRAAAAHGTCGPSTDDLAARRRELAELGRLAVAHAMCAAAGR